jgi:hypothetical protein
LLKRSWRNKYFIYFSVTRKAAKEFSCRQRKLIFAHARIKMLKTYNAIKLVSRILLILAIVVLVFVVLFITDGFTLQLIIIDIILWVLWFVSFIWLKKNDAA